MNNRQIDQLMELGLSKLQAKIYLTLYKEPNQTGYKIAQELNEPSANTYKALELLLQKGIILLDETGNNKQYSALPIESYLNQLEMQFSKRKALIEKEFKNLKPAAVQEGLFRIDNIYQLYENAKTIINNAVEVLAVDSTILPLEVLKPNLKNTAKRGVKVIVKTSSSISIKGCEIIYSEEMGSAADILPIQYLNLCSPGKDHLIAMLKYDNSHVLNAILNKNRFMTLVAYNGIFTEYALAKLYEALPEGNEKNEVLNGWKKMDSIRPSKISTMNDFIKYLNAANQ
jgi:sugar-specific transcriptional regulator TrmB